MQLYHYYTRVLLTCIARHFCITNALNCIIIKCLLSVSLHHTSQKNVHTQSTNVFCSFYKVYISGRGDGWGGGGADHTDNE